MNSEQTPSHTPVSVRIGILGSCISRDSVEQLDSARIEITHYSARHSLVSNGHNAIDLFPLNHGLTSAFQERILREDFAGNALPTLISKSKNADLILWDITDERGGLYELAPSGTHDQADGTRDQADGTRDQASGTDTSPIPSGKPKSLAANSAHNQASSTDTSPIPSGKPKSPTANSAQKLYVTCSFDTERSPEVKAALEHARHIPFGTDEHFALFIPAAEKAVDALREAGLLSRTLLIEAPWAAISMNLEATAPSFGNSADEANEKYERYYRLLESLGVKIVKPDADTVVADPNHVWGPAAFHYVPEFYQSLLAAIEEETGVTLPR